MSAMKLTPHLARYTIVILLAAMLLVGAGLALGHSGLLPYEGEIHYNGWSNTTSQANAYTLDIVRGLSTRLTPDPYFNASPDGRYALWSDNEQTFIVDTKTGARQVLPPNDRDLAWSPDGTRLLFTSAPEGDPRQRRLFLADADGSQAYYVSTQFLEYPTWSPDSHSVLATDYQRLYLIDAATGALRPLTEPVGVSYHFEWSYDGSQIAFGALEEGVSTVQVMNADGSNRRIVFRGQWSSIEWSSVHNTLLIIDPLTETYIADVSSDPPAVRQLVRDGFAYRQGIGGASWHPDGERVLLMVDFQGEMGTAIVNSISGQVELVIERGGPIGVSPDGESVAFLPAEVLSSNQLPDKLCIVTIAEGAIPHCLWLRTPLSFPAIKWLP